jgi:hypothetical protein
VVGNAEALKNAERERYITDETLFNGAVDYLQNHFLKSLTSFNAKCYRESRARISAVEKLFDQLFQIPLIAGRGKIVRKICVSSIISFETES